MQRTMIGTTTASGAVVQGWGIGGAGDGADEHEARGVRGVQEELEVAGFGGEDPVRLALIGDEHGGDSGQVGGWKRRVEDGDSEAVVMRLKRAGESEGDEARWS